LIIGLTAFYLLGLPTYYVAVQDFNPYTLIGKQTAEQIITRYPDDYASRDFHIYLPDKFSQAQKQRIYMSTRIRGIHQLTFSTYYLDYSMEKFLAGDFVLIENNQMENDGEIKYRIEEYPFSSSP